MKENKILPKAIVLTNGMLTHSDAKTAHGLIRGSERFDVVAVIDQLSAGKDAGEVLDGKHRNIQVYASVTEALAVLDNIQYCIIGIATVGGKLPTDFLPVLENCIRMGISIFNGLHEFLSDIPSIKALATEYKVELIDVRKPKAKKDLHFWTGEIFKIKTPILAVIGMDCAMGKRTTCRLIRQACETEGINAQMIYTGQTGWLQGGQYGFVFDSTLNDFISGELEHAIVNCNKETSPDLILLEGQSALRNPSGPCGSELLVSGNAKQVVLVVTPKRKHYEELPEWGEIPSVASEIALIAMYGSKVIAVAINTEHCSNEEAFQYQASLEKELGVPVLLPLQEGVGKLMPVLKNLIKP
ncbi:MAG: hypothetical protein CFE25_04815 [Chitinophagaceae bacterium BSSC1]|nr:MAG: hypothetical protein CFE25_04815 [Chitinophagaceae bacterium BSSC1]